MNLLGIDNGYGQTKIIGENIRRIFPSAFTTNEKVVSGTSHINIDGKDYYVGVGKTVFNPDKTSHEINKVCTLSALALTGSDDYYLIAGLPIGQFKQQKDKFKEIIMNYNNCKVVYYDKEVNINIKDVTIYPQGAASIYTLNRMNGKYILVDVGAYTIDIALIEMVNGSPTILKYDTWFKGISTLYSPIINAINNVHNLSLDPLDAEEILVQGFLKVDGKQKDITIINSIIETYLDDLFTLLDVNYKSRTTDIYLSGGGAEIVKECFQTHYPQTQLIRDSQFANANGFYRIGLQKYYKYLIGNRR